MSPAEASILTGAILCVLGMMFGLITFGISELAYRICITIAVIGFLFFWTSILIGIWMNVEW